MISKEGEDRLARLDAEIAERVNRIEDAAAPMLRELRASGLGLSSTNDLMNLRLESPDAVEILLRWLPLIADFNVKELIARALHTREARTERAQKLLVNEFKTLPPYTHQSSVRWAIGNTIAFIADDRIYDDVANIASSASYGLDRQMFVVALGRMKRPEAAQLLLSLLDDRSVTLHALEGLEKLKTRGRPAIAKVRSLLRDRDSRISKAASKTLKAIEG